MSVDLLDRMLARGDLPHLAELSARGRRLALDGPADDYPAASFHSLYSGLEVAEHGLVYPFQWSAGEQRVRYVSGLEMPAPVWERLGPGHRSLAIDPYESRPTPPRADLDALAVCGWGFRERVVLPRWSYPRRAIGRLERRHGRGADATEVFGERSPRELLRMREALLRGPRRTAALARERLAADRHDLAWLTFTAAHLGGHAFWNGSSAPREALDGGTERLLAGALEELYVEVDSAVGAVSAVLPEGSDVIVVSPVGMDVNTSRTDLLPAMLDAVLSGSEARPDPPSSIWSLRDRLPGSMRRRIAASLPRSVALALTARLELRGVDWSRTPAFATPGDNQGYIRLNLRGRERDGIVEPGAEAEELLARIAEGLGSFQLEDGSPAVRELRRSDQLYEGPRADRLPDLIVQWSPAPSVGPELLRSDRFGVVARRGAGSGRSGNHTPGDGWAVLAPGSASHREPSRPPRLEDVSATVLELLGEAPSGGRGEPLLVR